MTTVPLIVSAMGMLAGGWLTDYLTRSVGKRGGRAIPAGVTKLLCVAFLLACPWLPTAWSVTGSLALMAATSDLGNAAIWAYAQDVGGPRVGAVCGWGNMWGNFGAGLSPVLLGWAQMQYGWNVVFYLGASAYLLAAVTGALIDSSVPLPLQTDDP
jgi:ACS family glucarate transporter-like MFS transporter